MSPTTTRSWDSTRPSRNNVNASFLVTTSKALVPSIDALVTSIFLLLYMFMLFLEYWYSSCLEV